MEKPALIETLHVHADRQIPLLDWHLQRLKNSAQALHYRLDIHHWLATLHEHIAQQHRGQPLRLRMLHHADGSSLASSSVLAPLATPLLLCLSPQSLPAHPYLAHKTTHRPWFATAQQYLQEQPQYFDVVFVDEHGWVLEGSRSNLYMLDAKGQWLTPPLRDAGILPGVQRQALLDQGAVIEQAFSLQAFRQAKAIRLSNALRGWQDARLIEHKP